MPQWENKTKHWIQGTAILTSDCAYLLFQTDHYIRFMLTLIRSYQSFYYSLCRWLAGDKHHSPTGATNLRKLMLKLPTASIVSTNTSSALLTFCPLLRYIYTCHNNTIFQMGYVRNMKWNRRGMESSLIRLVSERKESPVSLRLPHSGKTNHNADKCTFLSNLWM